MKNKFMKAVYKKAFISLELFLVLSVLAFVGYKVWEKNKSIENDVKITIVKDDVEQIFQATLKAKNSVSLGNGTYQVNMEDIKKFLPDSMTLVGTGTSAYVTSLATEIGDGIKYYLAHADATGSKFKLFIDGSKLISSKSLPVEKIKLFETYALDTTLERAGGAVIAHGSTAIGTVATDFTANTTDEGDGVFGLGNLSF